MDPITKSAAHDDRRGDPAPRGKADFAGRVFFGTTAGSLLFPGRRDAPDREQTEQQPFANRGSNEHQSHEQECDRGDHVDRHEDVGLEPADPGDRPPTAVHQLRDRERVPGGEQEHEDAGCAFGLRADAAVASEQPHRAQALP